MWDSSTIILKITTSVIMYKKTFSEPEIRNETDEQPDGFLAIKDGIRPHKQKVFAIWNSP